MSQEKNKKEILKMDKGWQWLIYLDLVLPALLFVLALLPIGSLANTMAKFFHTYNIYIINTIPHLPSGTGIVGILLHLGVIIYTLVKNQYKDLGICIAMTAVNVLYFSMEWNYVLTSMLPIAATL